MADAGHLEILKKVIEVWNEWQEENSYQSPFERILKDMRPTNLA